MTDTNHNPSGPTLSPEEFASSIADVRRQVGAVIVGQTDLVDTVLIGALCEGHVLLEGVPGLGKTKLLATLGSALDVVFGRIQFTPDLMPADILGTNVLQGDAFEFHEGPIFANLVLADEINRATPKTQSALLEAMQERSVTLGGERHQLPRPFLVMATQNPIEQEGTYPLPEAQLDRFLVRVSIGYPDTEVEREILRRRMERGTDDVDLSRVVDRETLVAMQQAVERVHVSEPILAYAVEVVTATRSDAKLQTGASPRGSLALVKLARARAALKNRDYVVPDDIQAVAVPALAHRVILRPEHWVRGVRADDIIADVVSAVPTPLADDLVHD